MEFNKNSSKQARKYASGHRATKNYMQITKPIGQIWTRHSTNLAKYGKTSLEKRWPSNMTTVTLAKDNVQKLRENIICETSTNLELKKHRRSFDQRLEAD